MSSIGSWEHDKGLPSTLEGMLKETEINNTFKDEVLTEHLVDSMQSSFAYLYRFQQLATHFKRMNFVTRDFLLETTYSQIQDGLDENWKLIHELEKDPVKNKEAIEKAKETIAKLIEVRYGDLYVDNERRICCNVDYDIILPGMRDYYRQSSIFGKELSPAELNEHRDIFIEVPIVLIDHELHANILVQPKDKYTKFIFNDVDFFDVYTRTDRRQIYHDLCFLFVENCYFGEHSFKISAIEADANGVQCDLADLPRQNILDNMLDFQSGMFICGFSYPYEDAKEKRTMYKTSSFLPMNLASGRLYAEMDDKSRKYLRNNNGAIVTVSIYFLKGFHFFTSKYFDDGIIRQMDKRFFPEDPEIEFGSTGKTFPFFVPVKDRETGEYYEMPIPESNIIVMKHLQNKNGDTFYAPTKDAKVDSFYPNIYQIVDGEKKENSEYKIFYFYRDEEDKKYSSLFLYYHKWLSNRFSCTFEEALNKVYAYTDDSWINEHGPDIYALIKYILSYKDYEYLYGTPDFENYYVGDDIPRQYKAARMREFVRADWKILSEYVKKEKDNNNIYHFFTNTINLNGRRRRSTRLEYNNHPYMFADKAKKHESMVPGALKVTSNESYDFDTEVYIDDVKILLPDIEDGDYVTFENLVNRYVFAFKNEDDNRNIPFHIYVDGLLITDVEVVHKLGVDYLYIPMKNVEEDSYIMIERDFFIDQPVKVTVNLADTNEFTSVHFVESEHLSYTMNDVYLESTETGENIPKDLYEIKLERNKVGYGMYDERNKKWNKYGFVTDVQVRLKPDASHYGPMVNVCVDKDSYTSIKKATSKGYPRFYLDNFESVDELNYVRMYMNGRKVDNSLYKMGIKNGTLLIQSRVMCNKGDDFVFEITPYSRQLVYALEELPKDYILDFTKILNKPFNPEYYEVYLNGRRLGLPNAFELGPHHGTFKGLHSNHRLEIYEKERDFEYFGYEQINLDSSKDTYEYFFAPIDLINKSFVTDKEKKQIVDNYIDQIKHPKAIIKENVIDEPEQNYDFVFNILEDIRIFYYDDLLPLGLANADEVQFNNEYLTDMYPFLTDQYMRNDANGNKVLFLNPDLAARSEQDNFDSYEKISVDEMEEDNSFVYLMGENDETTYPEY